MKLILATLTVVAVLALPVVVSAAQPTVRTYEIDDIWPSGGLTARCGFDVFHTAIGTMHSSNHDVAAAVLELDRFEGTFGLYAPSSEKSLTFHVGVERWEYPEGLYLGAPARVTFTGLAAPHAAGYAAPAGETTFEGVVLFIDPNGFGYVDLFDPSGHGSDYSWRYDFDAWADSLCGALAE